MLDFIKEHLHPSSPFAVFLIMSVGIVGLYLRSASRWPRPFLVAVVAGYWFISTPLGASLLLAGLARGFAPLHDRAAARGAEAVVVLGGGATTYSAGGQVIG